MRLIDHDDDGYSQEIPDEEQLPPGSGNSGGHSSRGVDVSIVNLVSFCFVIAVL